MELIVDEYVEMWKRCLDEQEKQMSEIRSIKHDMQAHMLVLQYYLEEEMYDKAKAYLHKMRNKEYTENAEIYVETGNSLVNAIIKDYLKKSGLMIQFVSNGELPNDAIITDYDWCTVFSNLMSNAIEACQKLQDLEKVIYLQISTDEKNLCITMTNPVQEKVEKEILEKGTTKEEKEAHGFGLKNVRKVVEKYNGRIEYQCERNDFSVRMILPKSEIEK